MRSNRTTVLATLLTVCVMVLVTMVGTCWAGTGGGEIQSFWTYITNALQGYWGKILAAIFVGFALMAFRAGSVIGGFIMLLIGLSIGTIPNIVNARFTLTF